MPHICIASGAAFGSIVRFSPFASQYVVPATICSGSPNRTGKYNCIPVAIRSHCLCSHGAFLFSCHPRMVLKDRLGQFGQRQNHRQQQRRRQQQQQQQQQRQQDFYPNWYNSTSFIFSFSGALRSPPASSSWSSSVSDSVVVTDYGSVIKEDSRNYSFGSKPCFMLSESKHSLHSKLFRYGKEDYVVKDDDDDDDGHNDIESALSNITGLTVVPCHASNGYSCVDVGGDERVNANGDFNDGAFAGVDGDVDGVDGGVDGGDVGGVDGGDVGGVDDGDVGGVDGDDVDGDNMGDGGVSDGVSGGNGGGGGGGGSQERYLLAAGTFFGALIVGGAIIAGMSSINTQTLLALTEWFESSGPNAIFLYSGLYFLLELIAVPALPLTLGSGYLFGALRGTIAISIASTAAASVAFLIARYGLRDAVSQLASRYPRFRAIDRAIAKQSFKFVFLLRLSPLLPFSISNYLYGLTSVNFLQFSIASWVGMLPGTIAYVSAGAAVNALTDIGMGQAAKVNPYLLLSGVAGTVGVLITIGKLASRAISEVEEDENSQSAIHQD